MSQTMQELVTTPRMKVPSSHELHPQGSEAEDLIRRAPMGYVWNQISSLWLFASTFLFTIVLTHNLSKGRYGDLVSALTIFNTAVYLAAFGLEDATSVFVPRALAEEGRAAAGGLIRRTLITRLIFVVLVTIGLVWLLPTLAPILATIIASLGAPGFASQVRGIIHVPGVDALAWPVAAYVAGAGLMNQLAAIFTSILRTRITLMVGGIAQLGNLLGAYLVLNAGHDIAGVLWAVAGVAWLAALAYFILLAPFWMRQGPRQAIPSFLPVLKMGGTVWIVNFISGALLKQIAVSLLQQFVITSVAIGFFNLAFQTTHAAAFLLIAGLGGVGMAAMSAAYAGRDRVSLAFAWRAISKVQILLAVPLLAFCFIYAPQIAITLYGNEYRDVGMLLQVFLIFNIVQRLAGGGAHQAALYILGRQQLALWTQGGGLILTILLGFLLIPGHAFYNGAAGALIAVGMGQVAVELAQLALAWRFLKKKYPLRFGIRVVLALIPPTLIVWLLHPSNWLHFTLHLGPLRIPTTLIELIIAVTIFAVTLIVSLAIAKPIEHEDVTLLAQVNPRLRPILSPFASGSQGGNTMPLRLRDTLSKTRKK